MCCFSLHHHCFLSPPPHAAHRTNTFTALIKETPEKLTPRSSFTSIWRKRSQLSFCRKPATPTLCRQVELSSSTVYLRVSSYFYSLKVINTTCTATRWRTSFVKPRLWIKMDAASPLPPQMKPKISQTPTDAAILCIWSQSLCSSDRGKQALNQSGVSPQLSIMMSTPILKSGNNWWNQTDQKQSNQHQWDENDLKGQTHR